MLMDKFNKLCPTTGKRKVLKEISVGDLKPNETVQAHLEAQLLSKLDHPAIVKFHASFVERDNFCIITEYCEGRDLDCKIQEYKEAGNTFPESQIIEWFIQLLLGVDYMHERYRCQPLRILHRDLKAKNIFLKNNLLKIGDFGVSRLLMGSCDLATTFTGTPYYMSPEALKHQGYDTKSDIWSLACILYELCCLNHAFTGHNFLSIVLKIVEGETPSLPPRYPQELNVIMQSMLNKSPSLRPSAIEILKIPYLDEQLKLMMCKYSNMTLEDKNLNCQKESAHLINAVQRKIHLQTLRELSEVQKMTPRERMRLRKLHAADEKEKKLKKLAEEKYKENTKRMQELRSRNVPQSSIEVLRESDEQASGHLTESEPNEEEMLAELSLTYSQPVASQSSAGQEPNQGETSNPLSTYELEDHEIPEDPLEAEEYYVEVFDSCSEASEKDEIEEVIEVEEEEEEVVEEVVEEMVEEEEELEEEKAESTYRTSHQDSDIEALVRCLENVLGSSSLGSRTVTSLAPVLTQGPSPFNNTVSETKMKLMRESAIQKLGLEVFETVYSYLKKARRQDASEDEIRESLEKVVPRASDCFEVDQLIYFEEQLKTPREDSGLQNHL
ncbi:serine/threonine-protein kinase Nek11 isoform X3 [Monodelphis domestica]|uniref:serine/threonine-protein kinase Nek11 isoform X3 n=1 Tax=Monodelphis domestica TaxID=13616 RepID=UPI0024E26250|nr:serine/threonine-protein kinase Nek11 isoform X3 [Monodelphis domestica]